MRDSPSRTKATSPNVKNDEKTDRDNSACKDKNESGNDGLSPKTSSTRRKLKLPRKNAHILNKVSPGKRRMSRRNIDVVASKAIDNITSHATDKENKSSFIMSNAMVANSLQEDCNVMSNTKHTGKELKSVRKSSSNTYSPVVKFTPTSKKKIERQEDQITKIVQLRSEVHVEVTTKENSVLREIGSRLDVAKPVKSPHKTLMNADKDQLHMSPNKNASLESKVLIEKLSPQNEKLSSISPVKVLTEDPLTLAPLKESNDPSPVARRINFDNPISNESLQVNNEINSQNIENNQVESVNADKNSESQRVSRKRRTSSVVGNTSKKAKTKTDGEDCDDAMGEKNGNKKLESSNKRSKRIANKTKNKSSEAQHLDDTSKLLPDGDTKSSVEKQPSQKMRRNKYGESPLHVAVKRGDIEKVRSLLLEGANANSKDHAGWRPIHESMREGENALRIIRLLVDHGADINAKSDSGNTALHDAAAYMSHEIIEYLVQSGADPAVKNLDGKSPLDISKMPQYARSNEIQKVLGNKVNDYKPQGTEMDIDGANSDNANVSVETSDENIRRKDVDLSSGSSEKFTERSLKEPVCSSESSMVTKTKTYSVDNQENDTENSINLFSNSEKDSPKSLNNDKMVCNDIKIENDIESINGSAKDQIVTDKTENVFEESSNSKLKDDEKGLSKNIASSVNEVLASASGSPTSSNSESNVSTGKTCSEKNESEEDKSTEQSQVKKANFNIKRSNVTISTTTKRLERRSNIMSPFGPGSRGARLLEMSSKRSKSSNFPVPTSNGLNNSFSESNSCESNPEVGFSIATDSSSTVPSKFALMSPRVENRRSLPSQLPALSKQQEKVKHSITNRFAC